MVSPAHFRQIFTFSGIRAPFTVLPTICDSTVLVCAADTVLTDLKKRYDFFSTGSRTSARKPPKLTFRNIEGVSTECDNANRTKRIVTALRKEVCRLEDIGCTERPRRHFSKRFREWETAVYNKLKEVADTHAPEPPPPPRAPDYTTSKRQRGPEAADNGGVDDDGVMSDAPEFNEPPSN